MYMSRRATSTKYAVFPSSYFKIQVLYAAWSLSVGVRRADLRFSLAFLPSFLPPCLVPFSCRSVLLASIMDNNSSWNFFLNLGYISLREYKLCSNLILVYLVSLYFRVCSPPLSCYTFFLTKGMVSLVVAVVVLLSVDPRAENWYAVNKHIYSYLPQQLSSNGPTLRQQLQNSHWNQLQNPLRQPQWQHQLLPSQNQGTK